MLLENKRNVQLQKTMEIEMETKVAKKKQKTLPH
jgi:hypothetical protein